MKPDISFLYNFYKTSPGLFVQKYICEKINSIWPQAVNDVIVGYGYCIPYLDYYISKANRTLMIMPGSQGCLSWPCEKKCSTTLTVDNILCLENKSVNRLIMIHSFEHSQNPELLLQEVRRVLVDEGHFLLVVPNRHWIGTQKVFQGTSYSAYQLCSLLTQHLFLPLNITYGLFSIPNDTLTSLKTSIILEKFGSCWFPKLGKLIIIEGSKKSFSPVRHIHSSLQAKFSIPQSSF